MLFVNELLTVLDIELSANRLCHFAAHQVVEHAVSLDGLGVDGDDASWNFCRVDVYLVIVHTITLLQYQIAVFGNCNLCYGSYC